MWIGKSLEKFNIPGGDVPRKLSMAKADQREIQDQLFF